MGSETDPSGALNTSQKSPYAPLFALLSLVGVVVWCWLLFRAGCYGGGQPGSYADPVRSKEFERSAAPFLLAGAAAGLAYIASMKHLSVGKRATWGVRLVLFGLPIAWSIGVQLALLGLRICI